MNQNVQVTVGTIVIPTYPEPEAEKLPMFAENRVHQRSSGNPYPNHVVLKVNRKEKIDRAYRCITLENEYLKIQVLPELGGRIYSALDKTTGYDFFYKQHVIKPALIGCLGSWISGGMEFNWPFHHRASTFTPADDFVKRTKTGGAIVWLSEHDPIDRMKGMVGICLEPGKAIFETRMRLCNRTPLRHSFLWWENAAVPVNVKYQIFFPQDVSYVQFHYKYSVTTYPLASNALGVYNGIRYNGATDISMHKNTRQPTSYFCAPSKYDFFGGYDNGKQCGVIHVSNHHTASGKKMFTWAYNQLAKSWESALTDTDGAYAELMAGSYSDNQPDFSWLEPYETKCFSQYWFPFGALGIPTFANYSGALRWDETELNVQLTQDANVEISVTGSTNAPQYITAALKAGFPASFPFPSRGIGSCVRVTSGDQVLLDYTVQTKQMYNIPECTQDMPNFKTEQSPQELYLEGVHVQQYRDPAVEPDAYWQEAILRDPAHIPSLTALAEYRYRQCRFAEAQELAERTLKQATHYNKRTESGKLYFLIGLILLAQNQRDEAYDFFWKSSWCMDTYSAAMTRIAAIDGQKGEYAAMAAHCDEALRYNADHPLAAAYHAIALLHLNNNVAAREQLRAILQRDPLNHLARFLSYLCGDLTEGAFFAALQSDPSQTALDLNFDLAQCGCEAEGKLLLQGVHNPSPMVLYLLGNIYAAEKAELHSAFPFRMEEYLALKQITADHPELPGAQYHFGCLLYSKRQYKQAAECFQKAILLRPSDYTAYRNLAALYYSHLNRSGEVLPLLNRALALAPKDEQLVYETAYVMQKLAQPPALVIAFILENTSEPMREDTCIELARVYNLNEQYDQALEVLSRHVFVPCEGGEHAVADQYMFAHHAIGRRLFARKEYASALEEFRAAQVLPQNLGAGIWNEVKYVPHQYYEAQCLDGLGETAAAEEIYRHILDLRIDYFSEMYLKELAYYQAQSLIRLGNFLQAQALMDAYQKRVHAAMGAECPGFYSTTPFFLSYCDDPRRMRDAAGNRLLGYFDLFACRPDAKSHFAQAAKLDQLDLYARLELQIVQGMFL